MRGRGVVLLAVLFLLFSCPLGVAAAEEREEDGAQVGKDAFLEELRTLLPEGFSPDVTDADALGEAVGVRALFSFLLGEVRGSGDEVLSFFFLLMGASLFFSLAGALRAGAGGTLGEICETALAAVLSLALFERMHALLEETAEGLSGAGRFFGGILPLLTGITAAGGGGTTAASQAMTMEMTLSVLTALTDGVLLPLAMTLFALGLLGAIGGEGGGALVGMTGSVRRLFLWLVGVVAAVLAAALAMQSVISSAADSAAMRAARFAAADLLPLVGGAVSGALSAAASGLLYVKSIVGVSSVAALLFLSLPVLVRLLLYRAAFGVAIGFLSCTGAKAGERTLSAFRAALDTLIALFALSLLLYIFGIVCFMKCGVAVA